MPTCESMLLPSSTPSLVGDKRIWDITTQFRQSAALLSVGTLVKDESFTLFESVGALEIMDQKMDSGCLGPGESLVDEYDLERPLLPEEVIGIMDQFLCYEMAWHEGYPLAQTLFSSHYIDKLLSLEAKTLSQVHFTNAGKSNCWSNPLVHVVLRAYCVGLIKSCDYVLEEINRSLDGGGTRCNFYEEEDFAFQTYGRELLTAIGFEPIAALLLQSIEFIDAERAYSMQGRRQSSSEVYDAIKDRLALRLSLVHAMSAETSYEAKRAYWKAMPTLILPLKSTHALGKPVGDSFSPKIQRRLASSVPPKPMVEKSFVNAIANLEQLCNDCTEALRIIEFGPEHVQSLKAFLWSFNGRKPEAWTYPRACLSAPLFICDEAGFELLLRRDLADLVLPESDALDPMNWTVEAPLSTTGVQNRRYQFAQTINHFTQCAIKMPGGYIDYFRALTSNRCRVRRNLTHTAVALEDLQMRETEQLDKALSELGIGDAQFPLSTWTYLQKLRVMEWIVQLGFELDVYLVDELAGMYWYLSLLATTRSSLLQLILSTAEAKPNGHASETNHDGVRNEDLRRNVMLLQSLNSEAQGTASLATALSSLYIYSSYHDPFMHSTSKPSFCKPALQYELRMKPFHAIKSPPVPTHQEWDDAIHPFGDYSGSREALRNGRASFLTSIDQHVGSAKEHFAQMKKRGAAAIGCGELEDAWVKNTSALLQSCIAAGITLAALKSFEIDHNISVMVPEQGPARYHDWWIIPKLRSTGAGGAP